MKIYEKYLTTSLLNNISEILGKGTQNVPSEYKGYISSLGASIVSSGLVPTLAFFQDGTNVNENPSKSSQPREPLLKVLGRMIHENGRSELGEMDLFHKALELKENSNSQGMKQLTQEIKDASIALKLALRSFNLVKTEKRKEGGDV